MSLKHSILALLSRGPKTGYELANDAGGSTRFFWASSHQQIYKELSLLEKKGWVRFKEIEQTEKPDKKVYSLTKDGLKELKNWMLEESELQPSKDSLLIKIFVGDFVDPNVLLKELLRHKEIHKSRLKKYLSTEKLYFKNVETLPLESRFQHLTLRRGISYENGWLNWCKEVEDLLLSLIK